MRSLMRFLEGFVLGGLVGAAAAILLAPFSGEDLRLQIKSEAERIQAEVKTAASERRTELERQLEILRTPHTSASD
jgi:gas vesicle protein